MMTFPAVPADQVIVETLKYFIVSMKGLYRVLSVKSNQSVKTQQSRACKNVEGNAWQKTRKFTDFPVLCAQFDAIRKIRR